MKKLNNRKIARIIEAARDRLKSSDDGQLRERLNGLQKLRKEFSKKYSEYKKVLREHNRRIEAIREKLKDMVQELEIISIKKIVLSNSIPLRVPDDIDKLKGYVERLINIIQSLKPINARMYIDRLRDCYSEIDSLRVERSDIDKVGKEFNDIYNKVEQEVNAIQQFLAPEENILVNVRERFD
ncbi:MAG: hypothetical protein ACP5QK_12835 [Myxococcota bacterium]